MAGELESLLVLLLLVVVNHNYHNTTNTPSPSYIIKSVDPPTTPRTPKIKNNNNNTNTNSEYRSDGGTSGYGSSRAIVPMVEVLLQQ